MLIDLNDAEWDLLDRLCSSFRSFSSITGSPENDEDFIASQTLLKKLKEAKVEEEVEKISEKMMEVRFILQRVISELLDKGDLHESYKDSNKEETFISDFILKYCVKEGTWNLDFPSK